MTQDEEKYVHLVSCADDLNEAWRLLHEIRRSERHPLTAAAFRYAVVAYSRAYVSSRGVNGRYCLEERYVPSAYHELHHRLIKARHQIHADSDLTVREAQLHIAQIRSRKWVGVVQNVITGTEEIPNISETIALIESTLPALYGEIDRLEALLPVPLHVGGSGA